MKDNKSKKSSGLSPHIEALLESEKRFRIIAETANDAIIIFDKHENIIYWNDAAKRIFGYNSGETMGKLVVSIMPEKYQRGLNAEIKRIQTDGGSEVLGKAVEMVGLRKDGSEFPIELSLAAWQTKNETFFTVIVRDITKRKKVEKELIEQAGELARSNIELEKARETAEKANKSKSDFLASMSHEIRTPMNGIIGMTTLLCDTHLTEEQLDFVDTIKFSGESLLQIINDILDVSKIEAGKLELETINFNLRSVVDKAGDLLAEKVFKKGLTFAHMIKPEVPTWLKGDPGRIRQILVNLVGNALKFTSEGEIVIYVSLIDELENEAVILFEIKDTGIGIPRNKLSKIFKAFTQADVTTTRKYGGSGLGLSISRRLVSKMGGEISVESEVGKGSTFRFSLPLKKQKSGEHSGGNLTGSLKGKKILVVDHNETNRDILGAYLHSWKCNHNEVADTKQAFTVLNGAVDQGVPFDLVISDYVLPEMEGVEFGRAIKADPRLKNTALIMLTSVGVRGDAAKIQEIGFSGYLTKPVKSSQFYDCMLMVFNIKGDPDTKNSNPGLVTRHTVAESEKLKFKILVAEDNIVNQKLALKLIEKFGYHAKAVSNGEEAIKELKTNIYDLVFMDIQMPELNGLEATEIIRGSKSKALNNRIPIIAMTAHAMLEDRDRCLAVGMNDYIPKPVNPEILLSIIEKYYKSDMEI